MPPLAQLPEPNATSTAALRLPCSVAQPSLLLILALPARRTLLSRSLHPGMLSLGPHRVGPRSSPRQSRTQREPNSSPPVEEAAGAALASAHRRRPTLLARLRPHGKGMGGPGWRPRDGIQSRAPVHVTQANEPVTLHLAGPTRKCLHLFHLWTQFA